MKVLHLNQQSTTGGTARIATTLVNGLVERGINAELWYFFNKGVGTEYSKNMFPFLDELQPDSRFKHELNRWVNRNSRYLGGHKNVFFGNVYKRIKLFQPDIVHIHNLHGGWADFSTIMKLSREYQIVITLHDEWLLTGHCGFTMGCEQWRYRCESCPDLNVYPALRFPITKRLRAEKRSFLKILAENNVVLVTPSQWMKRQVQRSKMWNRGREVQVIPNGINTSLFRDFTDDKFEYRSQLDLPQDKKILLFVADGGSKNEFKGFSIIKEAVKRLGEESKSLTVVVGGDKSVGTHKETINGVDFIRVGFLEKKQLIKYYKAADAFLYPTKAETFGLVVVEAMAAGLPVITTKVNALPELIDDQKTGVLIEQRDVDSVVHAIKNFVHEQHDYPVMGQKGKEFVMQRFDTDFMISNYINLYDDLLNLDADHYSEQVLV